LVDFARIGKAGCGMLSDCGELAGSSNEAHRYKRD